MNTVEFLHIRQTYCLPTRWLTARFQTNAAEILRWESGESPIPIEVALTMMSLYQRLGRVVEKWTSYYMDKLSIDEVILIHYVTSEDIKHFCPDAIGLAHTTYQKMLYMTQTQLLLRGRRSRILRFDRAQFNGWNPGLPDIPENHIRWAAATISPQKNS